MKCFSCTAEGDTIYWRANSLKEAQQFFNKMFSFVPAGICQWVELEELPEGEEYFN